MGSGAEKFETVVSYIANQIHREQLSGPLATAALSSCLQAVALLEDAAAVGVGGPFIAAEVDEHGANLQLDTTHVIFVPDDFEKEPVPEDGPSRLRGCSISSVRARADGLIVTSRHLGDPLAKLLTNQAMCDDEDRFERKAAPLFQDPADDFASVYYCFLSRKSPAVVIHESPYQRLPTTHLSMTPKEGEGLILGVSDELRDALAAAGRHTGATGLHVEILGNRFHEDPVSPALTD